MASPLALPADPLVVIALALALFVVRVFYMARRLKAAAKNPSLTDLRALEDAKRSLEAHKESLAAARRTLSGNIEGSRDTLRHYRSPLDRARSARHEAIGEALGQTPFEQAKKLVRSHRPSRKKPSRSHAPPKDI